MMRLGRELQILVLHGLYNTKTLQTATVILRCHHLARTTQTTRFIGKVLGDVNVTLG